jgi:hypothetical protein
MQLLIIHGAVELKKTPQALNYIIVRQHLKNLKRSHQFEYWSDGPGEIEKSFTPVPSSGATGQAG